ESLPRDSTIAASSARPKASITRDCDPGAEFAGDQSVQSSGLVKLGHVAFDGSKIKANASKHKAMSYGRMEARARELEDEVRKWLPPPPAGGPPEEETHDPGPGGRAGPATGGAKPKPERKKKHTHSPHPTPR